jgi:hypothetical protein
MLLGGVTALDSWQAEAPFEAAGDAPRMKRGAPSVCRMQIRGLWEECAAQQMAGAMAIVQDDSHHGMGPWLQCILLDESITAQLHDKQPTLSAEACTRPSLQASGQASAPRDKRAQDGSCS